MSSDDLRGLAGVPPHLTERVFIGPGVELAVDLFEPATKLHSPASFLLVHGLASNARLFDGVARRLAANGHLVVAVDLRGHGRSSKPDDGYDYETLCGDLAAVIGSLFEKGFSQPVAVGQSFGGNLVVELAARRGGLISGVALIDGGTIDLQGRFASLEEVQRVLAPPLLEGMPYEELRRRFAENHEDWPVGATESALANFELRADGTVAPHLSLSNHTQILRTMWQSRPRDAYERVGVGVLLCPVESLSAPAERQEEKRRSITEAAAALGRARVHWLSGDHDVHAEKPDEVASVLEENLDLLAPRL